MFPVPEPVLSEYIIWIAIPENLHGKQKAASKVFEYSSHGNCCLVQSRFKQSTKTESGKSMPTG